MKANPHIFIMPTTDFAIKRIFRTERNKRFLIHFLNTFLSKYIGRIKDVTFLDTEQYGLTDTQRKVVFDILCTDHDERQFIIEMQRARQPEYAERSVFYLSRAISSSMEKGVSNYRIIPTYSVNLLDFELPLMAENSECFHSFFIKDEKNRTLTDKVGFFYINLCNFASQQSEVTEVMRSWMSLLKNMQAMNEEDYHKQSGIFQELMDECRIEKLDTMEKENYEKSILEYEDVREAVEYAKELSYAEGVEKGIAEGMEKGIQEGIAQGVRNGLLQAAANFLKMGISVDDVTKATGLSEEEVRKLKGEN